jgi:hypothetical protein
MNVYRTIKRLFKRLRRQVTGGHDKHRLSDHQTLYAALKMSRIMAKQTSMLTGAPLARGER